MAFLPLWLGADRQSGFREMQRKHVILGSCSDESRLYLTRPRAGCARLDWEPMPQEVHKAFEEASRGWEEQALWSGRRRSKTVSFKLPPASASDAYLFTPRDGLGREEDERQPLSQRSADRIYKAASAVRADTAPPSDAAPQTPPRRKPASGARSDHGADSAEKHPKSNAQHVFGAEEEWEEWHREALETDTTPNLRPTLPIYPFFVSAELCFVLALRARACCLSQRSPRQAAQPQSPPPPALRRARRGHPRPTTEAHRLRPKLPGVSDLSQTHEELRREIQDV